jgi:hypothetical protein
MRRMQSPRVTQQREARFGGPSSLGLVQPARLELVTLEPGGLHFSTVASSMPAASSPGAWRLPPLPTRREP